MANQEIHLHIQIPPDINPEAAAALGKALGQYFAGSGTAAQNHRSNMSKEPRAVADAAAGDTAADWRRRYVAWQGRHNGAVIHNPETKKDLPMRGALSQYWRDAILEAEAAEVKAAEGGTGDEYLDVDVDETVDAEPTVDAVTEGKPEKAQKGRGFRR